MPCASAQTSLPAASFGFSAADGALDRTLDNMLTLWSAPWRAWWALAFEAMDARNYLLDQAQ